jgi:hypothetical protein
MHMKGGGGEQGCREGGKGGSRQYDGPYLVVKGGGGRGKQLNHVLFPIVLMLCTMLPLVSPSPFSRSAEETSLDTKMDQVYPNTPRLLSSPLGLFEIKQKFAENPPFRAWIADFLLTTVEPSCDKEGDEKDR